MSLTTTPATGGLDRIVEVLSACTFRYARETQLHLGIEQALRASGFDPRPEVRIVGGRIDFIVGTTGIEVKVKGTAADLATQLARYSAEASLDSLLVVTTRTRHREVPRDLNGKPVRVLLLGGYA